MEIIARLHDKDRDMVELLSGNGQNLIAVCHIDNFFDRNDDNSIANQLNDWEL